MKLQAALLLLLTALPAHAAKHHPKSPNTLSQTIQTILSDPAVSRAQFGISVTTLDNQPIYALNAAQAFTPASNAKLFTTATALAVFSPETTFPTQIIAQGQITTDGVLNGDLILRGNGDPSLSNLQYPYSGKAVHLGDPLQPLQDLATQIAKSIHKITGRVIADDTAFLYERYAAGWGVDDLQWEYGAPVSALTVNDNSLDLILAPGANPSDPIAVATNPPIPYYSFVNSATTSAAGAKPAIGVDRQPGAKILRIYGTLPVNGTPDHSPLAIEDPAEFAALALRQMLLDHGVAIPGPATAQHNLPTSTADYLAESKLPLPAALPANLTPTFPIAPNETLLATHTSPPLIEDLTLTTKTSQNLHAELILRDLGKAVLHEGSFTAGARVVRQFLLSAGLDPNDFLFYDGSGLSTQDYITPRAATTLLVYAARQPWAQAFRQTLPIAGVDGTLAHRFTQSPVKGKLLAKTGSHSQINALSGYLTAKSGRTLAISILCNHHDPATDATRKAADRIIEAIYNARITPCQPL